MLAGVCVAVGEEDSEHMTSRIPLLVCKCVIEIGVEARRFRGGLGCG